MQMLQHLGKSIPDEFTKVIREYSQLTCFLNHSLRRRTALQSHRQCGLQKLGFTVAEAANGCFIA